ncbi:hypothetical protein VNO77_18875 [Canavalia gladiata]|uniref:Uncharacterized protein n=1 Tax=Canavalia gladiata TaxID=3824 RepID=A0AAN9QKS7_CANGL
MLYPDSLRRWEEPVQLQLGFIYTPQIVGAVLILAELLTAKRSKLTDTRAVKQNQCEQSRSPIGRRHEFRICCLFNSKTASLIWSFFRPTL